MAAAYCGLTYETFTQHCPVKPIEFTASAKGRRYLRHRLDEWLLSLDPNNPATASASARSMADPHELEDWNVAPSSWDKIAKDPCEPPKGAGGYIIIEDKDDPIRKWYDKIGFDARTMGREDMNRLMAQHHDRWVATIPGTPLIHREITVLKQLNTYRPGEKIHRRAFKCGPDTEDRLKARGFLVTFPDAKFPDRNGHYMFTDAALEAWKELR